MTLAAGLLRHRVVIEEYVPITDTSGEPIQDSQTGEITYVWSVFAEVWAAIEPISAREFIAAQAQQSKVTTRITIRHRPGVTAGMRVLHLGKIFNIEGVLTDKVSGLEYLTLPCSEGVRQNNQ